MEKRAQWLHSTRLAITVEQLLCSLFQLEVVLEADETVPVVGGPEGASQVCALVCACVRVWCGHRWTWAQVCCVSQCCQLGADFVIDRHAPKLLPVVYLG